MSAQHMPEGCRVLPLNGTAAERGTQAPAVRQLALQP